MTFGLNIVRNTYHELVNTIFANLIRENIEAYINDIVIKTSENFNHTQDLQNVFDKQLKYNIKLNQMKFSFGLTSGKFLGY